MKVLILKPNCIFKGSDLTNYYEAAIDNLDRTGVLLLPDCVDYEVVDIDYIGYEERCRIVDLKGDKNGKY